jgi:hypothetical protein
MIRWYKEVSQLINYPLIWTRLNDILNVMLLITILRSIFKCKLWLMDISCIFEHVKIIYVLAQFRWLKDNRYHVYLNTWKLWLMNFKIVVNFFWWMINELQHLVIFINYPLKKMNIHTPSGPFYKKQNTKITKTKEIHCK